MALLKKTIRNQSLNSLKKFIRNPKGQKNSDQYAYHATLTFLPSCLNNCTGFLYLLALNTKSSCWSSRHNGVLPSKYLADALLRPLSASSHRPLRSSNGLELLVPHTRTAMAQSRSFTSIGPSLWNALSPSTRSRILASNLSSTFSFLKTFFFSLALRTGSASEWITL